MSQTSIVEKIRGFFKDHEANTGKQKRLRKIVESGKDDSYLEEYLSDDKDLRIIANDILGSMIED